MRVSGPWALPEIADYLEETVLSLRLAATSENGWPTVVSLWFCYEKSELLCATKRSSHIAKGLIASSRCVFEIARNSAPYFGVRGQSVASVSDSNAIPTLKRLAERYLGTKSPRFQKWLVSNTEQETVLQIRPVAFHSWDYRKRMAG